MDVVAAPLAFALPPALAERGLALRPETDADTGFLIGLYATTRGPELDYAPWDAFGKMAFILHQFTAQRHYYRAQFPDTAFDVIEQAGEPIGRLYLEPRPTSFHIIDVTLAPSVRGQGIGTALIEALFAHAAAFGRGVGVSVERVNPALELYRRLGFVETADSGLHLAMEWTPDAALS